MNPSRKIRVLLAKPGLDGHDRGVKVVAKALMESGMEVIYLGMRCTPEEIVEAAIQEDVDVIGISNLSATHLSINATILELLKKMQLPIVLIAGGIALPDEIKKLKNMGVADFFGPGTDPERIVEFIENVCRKTK